MKATDHFKRTIQAYLDNRAAEDELFAVSYRKEGKNIDDCSTYRLNYGKTADVQACQTGRYIRRQYIILTRIISTSASPLIVT